jgi:hypothetical protein
MDKMETPVNFLEDAEKKLMSEMAVMFDKMKTQRDAFSMSGIEDMYDIPPIEGVIYEPYLKIPITTAPGIYYTTNKKLPKNEVIVYSGEYMKGEEGDYFVYCCCAVTNYGRIFIQERRNCGRGTGQRGWENEAYFVNVPITVLDPLPYKLPKWFLEVFKSGNSLHNIHSAGDSRACAEKTTACLQKLSKEFYLFAGKWKPHMTDKAELDIEGMRETIVKNTETIALLQEKNRKLEERSLELHLQNIELTSKVDTFTKIETITLKNREEMNKYKEVVIEFLENNNQKVDKIRLTADNFKEWAKDKVCLYRSDYRDVIDSQEELKEYRIYKKVKKSMTAHPDKVCLDRSDWDDVIDNQEELKEYRIYEKLKLRMTAHLDSE